VDNKKNGRKMYYLRLIGKFAKASTQNELAYSANIWISLLHSALNMATAIFGLEVIFGQVDTINGWDMPSMLAILGVYLTVSSVRRLFIGPSLEALAGMDGEVWSGKLDFTLLRPVDIQFLASFRHWQPMALIDLLLGFGVLGFAIVQLGQTITIFDITQFLVALFFAIITLYAILLALAGMVFWSPGFLFTWIFDSLFQMARYPVGLYPGWLRFILTWIIPVGIMTTIPAQALSGTLTISTQIIGIILSLGFLIGVSILFRIGLRRYASAPS
jgi:ABC-2 type transport system permease protein